MSGHGSNRPVARAILVAFAACILAQQIVGASPPAPAGGGTRPNVTVVDQTVRTMRLTPNGQVTVWQDHTSQKEGYLMISCFNSYGMGIETPSAGEILVGYDHFYDPGTDPFPCWYSHDTFYRGAVAFPLDGYVKIPSKVLIKAELTYRRAATTFRDAPGAYGVDYPVSCAAHLGLSTAPWSGPGGPDLSAQEAYTDLPQGHEGALSTTFTVNVTDAVGRMAAFPDSYHGFIFSGADESLNKDNMACLSHYTDFALTLTYALPKA